MVFPLIPVVAALNTGGHLVAHSAGGLIVYNAASGGYIAGTYISAAALGSFLSTGSAIALGTASTAVVGGAAIWAYGTVGGVFASIIGSAGIFGTSFGATGLTGFLMSIGVISGVSIIYPILGGAFALLAILLLAYCAIQARSLRKLRTRLSEVDEELVFSRREAKLVEKIIRSASQKHSWLWKKWMHFCGRLSRKAKS